MLRSILVIGICVVLTFAWAAASAQSNSSQLAGCLDTKGSIYNVSSAGKPTEPCFAGDMPIQLGSGTITDVVVGEGLAGGGNVGNLKIEIDPQYALTPACAPNEVPLSDTEGGWICTPPASLSNPNMQAKAWVIPLAEPANATGDRRVRTEIAIYNPGMAAAQVKCLSFEHNGAFLQANTMLRMAPAGGFAYCSPIQGPLGSRQTVIVVADAAVLTSASGYRTVRRTSEARWHMEAFPVNCAYPEGYEWVCEFAVNL